jgi:Tfp pilus assembly protein PilF
LLLLGLAAAFLAWRIVVTNMADWFLQDEGTDAAAHALRWNANNAQARYLEGLGQTRTDPERAMADLSSAIRNNPTDGPAYAVLARLKEESGKLDEAGQAMEAAAQMAPRRVDVQLEVARFWFRRGDITRAMQHLDVALTFGDFLRKDLFPELLKLAEDPATREAAFAQLLKQPVP